MMLIFDNSLVERPRTEGLSQTPCVPLTPQWISTLDVHFEDELPLIDIVNHNLAVVSETLSQL